MPRVSRERLEARRQEILDGARAAFARHGYEGATVRILETELGMSRGAIFHHFPDKSALFLAVARREADAMAGIIRGQGLVHLMRALLAESGTERLRIYLEVTRRLRTDADFRREWAARGEAEGSGDADELGPAGASGPLTAASVARLRRQRDAKVVRHDVPVDVLADYLELVLDGLVARLVAGRPVERLDPVLDLVESSVRARR
jgi:TetR/AcrR family transcriptional regulator, transcriptional repressor of aconitase